MQEAILKPFLHYANLRSKNLTSGVKNRVRSQNYESEVRLNCYKIYSLRGYRLYSSIQVISRYAGNNSEAILHYAKLRSKNLTSGIKNWVRGQTYESEVRLNCYQIYSLRGYRIYSSIQVISRYAGNNFEAILHYAKLRSKMVRLICIRPG